MSVPSRQILALLVTFANVGGCRCDRPAPPARRAETEAFVLERVDLERTDVRGLSGLAVDPEGAVWAVAEDQRLLVPLPLFERPHRGPDVKLRGVPEDWDTEAVAWLDARRIALGTELDDERDRDLILIAEIDGDTATVTERVEIPYRPWGVAATANHGHEGLCAAAPLLLVANENVGVAAARRFAPVASYDLNTGALSYRRLWLTSDTGVLSSLACRRTERGLEVIAIERHYGVGRLLRFTWPEDDREGIEPELLIDLVPLFFPLPNYEGLVWREDGTILLLADNDTGGVTGPNEVLVLTPRGSEGGAGASPPRPDRAPATP